MKSGVLKKPLPKLGRRTKVIDLDALVHRSVEDRETGLPLVIRKQNDQLEPMSWAKSQSAALQKELEQYGAILFRGFPLANGADFQAFAEMVVPGLYGQYGDLPKERENIYHSTPYPEDRMILYHQESSHLTRFPAKQMFFCVQPSPEGGATPIADGIEVAQRLGPELLARFQNRGLCYVRNFLPGLDVSWQDFFKTDSRDEVIAHCNEAGMRHQWIGDDGLAVYNDAQATIEHPIHHKPVFFNQIQLHHPYCLDDSVRDAMLDLYGLERFPRNVTFGDGTPIDADLMKTVGDAYEDCALRFDWQKGDVLMLDNLRFAHARDPFNGPRKILVAMADLRTTQTLTAAVS